MTDSHKGGTKSENVADSWEEAGDEATEKFFDERKKEIEMKKQKEEELLKAREAAQQMQVQSANAEKPAFQILKRPPAAAEGQSSSQQQQQQQDVGKIEEKTITVALQEKEAAYFQARERIFGTNAGGTSKTDDEQQGNTGPGANAQAASGGIPPPHPPYHAPTPRPRLPAMLRTPRPPLYQQALPRGIPPFGMPPPPPPPGAYTPPLPLVAQQRFSLSVGLQQPLQQPQQHPNAQAQQRFPYFDARIPPPTAAAAAAAAAAVAAAAAPSPSPYMVQQNPGQNAMGINPAVYGNDPVRNNPIPYGRPPAQLLSQNRFTPAFNDQTNRFY